MEDSVKSRHSREGAFPVNSVIITDATPPRPSVKDGLARKDTMNELVKDVEHAIDAATDHPSKESGRPVLLAPDAFS